MTASATLIRPEPAPARAIELVLAHAHLRLGALALARVELETMAGLGMLDMAGFIDLAEARWRTGDLVGAGEAAGIVLQAEQEDPIALVIAAEAASSHGRPSEARRLAQRAMASATGSIDAIFAGMPRAGVWPPDTDEPPPSAPTLFDRAPEVPVAPARAATTTDHGAGPSGVTPPAPSGPVTRGFWDDEAPGEPDPIDLPDPALELEAGRAALVAGSVDEAAVRLGLALRLAPALGPAVLEATAGARGAALAMVRGDAYRLAGHEAEARHAYAVAAHGGQRERRSRSRAKPKTDVARSVDAGLDGSGELDGTSAPADAIAAATSDEGATTEDDAATTKDQAAPEDGTVA